MIWYVEYPFITEQQATCTRKSNNQTLLVPHLWDFAHKVPVICPWLLHKWHVTVSYFLLIVLECLPLGADQVPHYLFSWAATLPYLFPNTFYLKYTKFKAGVQFSPTASVGLCIFLWSSHWYICWLVRVSIFYNINNSVGLHTHHVTSS